MAARTLPREQQDVTQKTILQILPSLVSGGVETGTLDLAKTLVDQGYRSLVISSGGPLVDTLEQQGSKHITLPAASKTPFVIWRNTGKIIETLKSNKVDIVHARSRAPAWSAYWATKYCGTTFITTFHGVYGHQNQLKRWYNSAMLRSKHTIAVSKFVAKHIEETYPKHSSQLHLIPRGIDVDKFQSSCSPQAINALREKWQVPDNKIIIMLPGRLTRIKGHRVLVEALATLDSLDFYCLFVGDEPGKDKYREELLSLIKSYNLQDKVKLTGNCTDMASAYQLADIVISASTKPESFGRVACEAQLSETMVVATNHGGSQETIAPALRPFMCVANEHLSLAAAIKQVQSLNQEERLKLGKQARGYILKNYTLDKMCRDTIALYELELGNRNKLEYS